VAGPNPYSAISLAVFLSFAYVGIYVYIRGPRRGVNRVLGLFGAIGAAWTFGEFMFRNSESPESALFWARVAVTPTTLWLPAFLHFTYEFPEKERFPRWVYAPALALWPWIWMSDLYTGTRATYYGPDVVYGGGYLPLQLFVLAFLALAWARLLWVYRRSGRSGRGQLDYILLALAIATAGGIANNLASVVPGVYPIGSITALGAFALVLHGIFRRGLFEIAPEAEEAASTQPQYTLPKGQSYLVLEEKPAHGFGLFVDAVTHGSQGLVLTRTPPQTVRERHGLAKTPIVWVGEQPPTPETQFAGDGEEVAYVVAKFLKESQDGIVLLDSFEYLVHTGDFRRALKLVYHLKEIVVHTNARIVLTVNPGSLDPKELSILQKELEALAPPAKRK
jgi:hypothetical protein